MRSVTLGSPAAEPLIGVIASISSKKIMHGDACLAFVNISDILRSDSPNHLLSISDPLTEMKLAFDSVATAFVSNVLPVPGGPNSRIPLDGCIPMRLNEDMLDNGHSTTSLRFSLSSSSPPISSQWTLGTSMNTSRSAEGLMDFMESTKSLLATKSLSKISDDIRCSSKSISGKTLLKAFIAASLQSAARSAPTNP